MRERWRFNRFKLRLGIFFAFLSMFHHNLRLCLSLNSEGLALLKFREQVIRDPFGALSNWNDFEGEIDPCSWFGVECSDGRVVVLNLKDLCLEGTLAPELRKLNYIKSIVLRNNSFSGKIPVEIGEMKELEVLDLGFNNLSGPFPSDLGNNLSLSILLLDNNKFLGSISPEIYQLKMLSELQVDHSQLSGGLSWASCNGRSNTWNTEQPDDAAPRRLVEVTDAPTSPKSERNVNITRKSEFSPPPPSMFTPSFSSADASSSSATPPPPASLTSDPSDPQMSSIPPPNPASPDPEDPDHVPSAPPTPTTPPNTKRRSKSNRHMPLILALVIGGALFGFISILGIVFCRRSKVFTAEPWAIGFSGQLQKAFVTGVPKLQRSELETACEDFSNIIGSLSDGTVYKGTLSSGVEIAVTSSAVKYVEDWTENLEAQFRKKIKTLSRVNHKNFVNLIGYCEEDEPFTRMMVFEYAPNGTLFEHIHIKEAEHLDWEMRLRIAMGMAYCLEHMHELNPPISHANLQSSSIYLTEDYVAKISDFSFWNEMTPANMRSASMDLSETTLPNPESNIYSFGVILFEMITGKLPYSVYDGSFSDWASDYLSRGEQKQPVREMVDPTLKALNEEQIEKLFKVIKDCVRPDPRTRPTMREVVARLKEITEMERDGVTPRKSALWWAELEILSTEGN